MIKVEVSYKDNAIVSITCKGHAGSSEYGHDIVCAAVSAILLGGMRALDEKNFSFKELSGLGSICCLTLPSERDEVALETILTQMQCVAASYPKFVTIERK